MRVAIVSDIHGNKPAMDAILSLLDARGPFDNVVGAGDFSVGGVYPAECLQTVRDLGWETIRGNTEELVAAAAGNGVIPPCEQQPEYRLGEAELARFGWFASRLTDHLEYIKRLPLRWETKGPSGETLVVVHATPWSSHEILRPDDDAESLSGVLDGANADVLLYGHIHYAYQRRVHRKLIGCVGSVGAPLDNDIRPCFVSAEDTGSGWSITHVRTTYDRDAYLKKLELAGFPGAEGMARTIRNAGQIR